MHCLRHCCEFFLAQKLKKNVLIEKSGVKMAIGFVRVEYIKRSAGRNMVQKAAYIDRAKYVLKATV